jgi:uncharacterized membrane protein YciS (DUF1049 family)
MLGPRNQAQQGEINAKIEKEAKAMIGFIRFCFAVIVGCIALYCVIAILFIFGYAGFMGWLLSTSLTSQDKPTPVKIERPLKLHPTKGPKE